jgi:hypothetical protein
MYSPSLELHIWPNLKLFFKVCKILTKGRTGLKVEVWKNRILKSHCPVTVMFTVSGVPRIAPFDVEVGVDGDGKIFV